MRIETEKRGREDSLDPLEKTDFGMVHRLADIGLAVSAEYDLDKLLAKIVSGACAITKADGCTLYLLKDDGLHFTTSKNISLGIEMSGTKDTNSFPPVPMDRSFVSAYAAITKTTVNIPDVYASDEFDFAGPKKYDERLGYRSQSMLVTPMTNHEGQVIGVLQMLNAINQRTGEVAPFLEQFVMLAESLASQAAMAITNVELVQETERLFESFLKVMGTALDARSKYTHGHVRRVAGLSIELANAINEATSGPFGDRFFSEDEINELRVAAWMHDIGKIITPQHVMDKAVKLESIFDRSELIKTRYELIYTQVKSEYQEREIMLTRNDAPPEKFKELRKERKIELATINEELEFLLHCNNPVEYMEDWKIDRLSNIAQKLFVLNGVTLPRISEDEFTNLSIRRGSITEDERKIMQDHINVTIRMLDKIPFSSRLKNAPLYAGSHHEMLDGTGYPNGLTADELPLQSRLLAMVDLFEALTASDRPYKKPVPLDAAYKIVQAEVDRGKLDEDLFTFFKEKRIYEKFLDKSQYDTNNLSIDP